VTERGGGACQMSFRGLSCDSATSGTRRLAQAPGTLSSALTRNLHPTACLSDSPAHRSKIELLLRVAVLKRSCTLTALLFCAGTIAAGSSVNALKFTSIDFPGARTTEATGINRHGHIVGSWEDPQTRLGHGFLRGQENVGRGASFPTMFSMSRSHMTRSATSSRISPHQCLSTSNDVI
jgi:hypothetical protein